MAVTRPTLSASSPTTNGPAARPSRLLASVRVPNAVARIGSAVRLATIAPAGPEVPAAKNTPTARSRSWAPPGGSEKPRPRNTSDAVEYAMAVVHLRIGTSLLSRSVTAPQMIMPTPMSRIAMAATPAALSGASP